MILQFSATKKIMFYEARLCIISIYIFKVMEIFCDKYENYKRKLYKFVQITVLLIPSMAVEDTEIHLSEFS